MKKLECYHVLFGLLGIYVLVSAVLAVVSLTSHDDTDSANVKSGLSVYTDYGTGCQYLAVGFKYIGSNGGLTPRLGVDGKPICKK